MRAAWLVLALSAATAAAEERHTLLVTTVPPLDGPRLADTLRAYLDGFDIQLRPAAPEPATDLREQLDAAAAAAAEVRALAAVRIADTSASAVEIQIFDRWTSKSIVASVTRPKRAADLYRTVALKVQALLRSTLYEQAERIVVEAPKLAVLIQPPPPPPKVTALSLEAAYALVAFPLGGLIHHGVSVGVRWQRRWLELGLSIDALAPVRAESDDVTALLYPVPIAVHAAVRGRRSRLEGAVGPVAELLVVAVDASSPTSPVRSDRLVSAAFGLRADGRVRLTPNLWIYLNGSVLGVTNGERYTVRGTTLLSLAQLQAGGEAGLGVALW